MRMLGRTHPLKDATDRYGSIRIAKCVVSKVKTPTKTPKVVIEQHKKRCVPCIRYNYTYNFAT
ncbi:MAG: hypothetical protein JWP59_2520, partial [Massilia sp.]|nr:hypothetical protein [Massilia sp.]